MKKIAIISAGAALVVAGVAIAQPGGMRGDANGDGNLTRDEVNAQAQRRLARGESPSDAIEYATAALMKKLLHGPSVSLRKAGENSNEELIDAARALFNLDKDQQG